MLFYKVLKYQLYIVCIFNLYEWQIKKRRTNTRYHVVSLHRMPMFTSCCTASVVMSVREHRVSCSHTYSLKYLHMNIPIISLSGFKQISTMLYKAFSPLSKKVIQKITSIWNQNKDTLLVWIFGMKTNLFSSAPDLIDAKGTISRNML